MSEDNWEDIFKNKLDSQQHSVEDEGWNVPSDKVWEDIEAQLPQEDTRKRRFLLFFIPVASLVLGAFVWYAVRPNSSVEKNLQDAHSLGESSLVDQSEKSTAYEAKSQTSLAPATPQKEQSDNTMVGTVTNTSSAKQAEAAGSTLKSVKLTSATETASSHSTNLSDNKNVAKKPANSSLPTKKVGSKLNSGEPLAIAKENLMSTSGASEVSNVVANAPKNEAVLENSDQRTTPWNAFQNLSIKALTPVAAVPTMLSLPTNYRKNPKYSSRYFINFAAGSFIMQPKNSGEQQHFSFNTNLGLEYAWSKHWSFEVGAQYLNLIQKLHYNLDLPYNGSNEALQSDGNFDSKYSGQVNTSLGDVNMSMVLSRLATSSLALGEKINLDVSGSERVHLLQFPIGVKYLFDLGNWAPYVKANYFPTFVLQSSVDFNAVNSNHPAVHHRGTNAKIANHPDFVSGIGGTLGVQYKVGSRLFIASDLQYQYLLTPLSKSQTVKPTLFGINLGLRFAL